MLLSIAGMLFYLFIPPYLDVQNFFFYFLFQVICRCVEDVQSWLWRARESALCAVHVLSLRLDCFAFLRRRTSGLVFIIYKD